MMSSYPKIDKYPIITFLIILDTLDYEEYGSYYSNKRDIVKFTE